MSHAATVSRGARVFVLAGAAFLVAATVAAAAGAPRAAVVGVALYGFVLHTVFGKGYSLLPAYFDRDLAAPRAPLVQAPLTIGGALAIGLAPVLPATARPPLDLHAVGAVLWAAGAGVFLVTIGWTIRDNPTGAETATAEAKAARRGADRIANAAMPVALAYLALGAYETAALSLGGGAVTGRAAAATHLLAVGTGALLVFAVGARLLPRLLRAPAPTWLVAAVLAPGVTAPALVVAWLAVGGVGDDASLLWLAVVALATATLGHAVLVGLAYRRAPSPRLGTYGVLAGAAAGVATVAVGALVGAGVRPDLLAVHPRLGLLGFLGLTIVGVAYHFYPPAVAGERADWLAIAAIGLLALGLLVELLALAVGARGPVGGVARVARVGRLLAVGGATSYATSLAWIFHARAARA